MTFSENVFHSQDFRKLSYVLTFERFRVSLNSCQFDLCVYTVTRIKTILYKKSIYRRRKYYSSEHVDFDRPKKMKYPMFSNNWLNENILWKILYETLGTSLLKKSMEYKVFVTCNWPTNPVPLLSLPFTTAFSLSVECFTRRGFCTQRYDVRSV